jgi:exodeoxyribonuclease-3
MRRKLTSWNVNGIRSAEKKGFLEWLQQSNCDFVGLQETKVSPETKLSDALREPPGYQAYWDYSTEKKGYSGVVSYVKEDFAPLAATTQFPAEILTKEGRLVALQYKKFLLLNLYFPNGGSGPERLAYKLKFYDAFLDYIQGQVKAGYSIIFCGDVNTAHTEIDLARPKENANTSGFMPIERAWVDKLTAAGFIDTFRLFHPNKTGQYTWWDQKTAARDRNVGWRIDYFFVSADLKDKVKDAFILPDVFGSDHCPVGIEIEL